MSSIFGILNTGRSGIYANQTGLSVTGNNIANVNTPGYSRQRVNLSGQLLGGVRVTSIQRMRDEFLAQQLNLNNARMEGASTLALNLSQLEGVLGDGQDSPLSSALRAFHHALQDLTNQPGGVTERETLRSSARQLASSFQGMTTQIGTIREQLDLQVQQQVGRVNQLASQIADLNRRLGETQGAASEAQQRGDRNALLDQRDQLVGQLSQMVPVRTMNHQNGLITIFAGDHVLVEDVNHHDLNLRVNQSNNGYHEVVGMDMAGQYYSLREQFDSGSLGSLLRVRDEHARQLIDDIDRLAASIVRDINAHHRLGQGMDGIAGRDFFEPVHTSAWARWTNNGRAEVTATNVLDPSALTFQDYEIRFTDSSHYDIVNTTTDTTVASGNNYTSGNPIALAGMSVTISDGAGAPVAGDVFQVNSYAGTTGAMELSAPIQNDPSAIAAGLTSATGDNRNALDMAALFDTARMGLPPTQRYEQYFDSLRLNLGMATERAQQKRDEEQIAQQQTQALADSVSGVSLDEEATEIIKYQRAFQASSRMISVTDELLQTLLQTI